jgi:hypothetical protein
MKIFKSRKAVRSNNATAKDIHRRIKVSLPYLVFTLSGEGIFLKNFPIHLNYTKRQASQMKPPSKISSLSPTSVLSVSIALGKFVSIYSEKESGFRPPLCIYRLTNLLA